MPEVDLLGWEMLSNASPVFALKHHPLNKVKHQKLPPPQHTHTPTPGSCSPAQLICPFMPQTARGGNDLYQGNSGVYGLAHWHHPWASE